MSDLLSRIKAGSDNVKLINWPGHSPDKASKVLLKILSQDEHQSAAFSTERHFKSEKIEISMVTAEEYESEKATQILFRALRDPEKTSEPISPTISDFRRLLTKNEKEVLADEYLTFEKDCSPSGENLSSDELDSVIAELKKKPEAVWSTNLSTAMLKSCICSMAKDLATLRAAKSSTSPSLSKQ
jgi:hypothetical protein